MFAVAAGALAVWVDVRFPRLQPGSFSRVLLHMGVAMAIGQLVVPAGIHRLTTTGSEALTVLAVVGIGLPVLTYTLLTAIWLMKLLRNGLGGAHRL